MKKIVLIIVLFTVNYCYSQKRVNTKTLKVSDYKESISLNKKDFVIWYYLEDEDDWEKTNIRDKYFQTIKLHRFEIDSNIYLFLERKYNYSNSARTNTYQKKEDKHRTDYYYLSKIEQKGNITSISLIKCSLFYLKPIKNHIESLSLNKFKKEISSSISAQKTTIQFIKDGNKYRVIVSIYPNKIGYNFSFESNYLEIEEDKISSLKNLIY